MRDRTIVRVKEIARRRWKKESGYHRQARVENTFFRRKSITGHRLRARHPKSQEAEASLACNILNLMTEIGRPESISIGASLWIEAFGKRCGVCLFRHQRQELTRVLAQVEITFSNSLIEAFWRSLKHAWLYLHTLDSLAAPRRLIEFYVAAHNEVMPHSAFAGQTPDEMFFGTGDEVTQKLSSMRRSAREERMKENRTARCGVCFGETSSGALLLQRPRSRMSSDAASQAIIDELVE